MSVGFKLAAALFLIAALGIMPADTVRGASQPIALRLPWEASKSWYYNEGPHTGTGSSHEALDFQPPDAGGRDCTFVSSYWVAAAAAGKVISVPNALVIDHHNGLSTVYYHLSNKQVTSGEVAAGTLLGKPSCCPDGANDGCIANGPHLHFYTTWNGARQDAMGLNLGGWVVRSDGCLQAGATVVHPRIDPSDLGCTKGNGGPIADSSPCLSAPLPDGCLLRGQPSNTLHVIEGGAQFSVPLDQCGLLALNCASGFVDVQDSFIATLPTTPFDGALLKEPSSATVYLFAGGTRFAAPDWPTLTSIYGDRPPIRTVPDGSLAIYDRPPADGTLLRDWSTGVIYITSGGAKFAIPDYATYLALYSPKPFTNLWPSAVNAFGSTPSDGSLVRDEAGIIFVLAGGARFAIPDFDTYVRVYNRQSFAQLWNSAVAQFSAAVARDGTLIRDEAGTIYVIVGGAKLPIPNLETYKRLYAATHWAQLWNAAAASFGSIPPTPALVRLENQMNAFMLCGSTKKTVADPTQFGYPAGAGTVLWSSAIDGFASGDPALGNVACNDDDDGDGYSDLRETQLGRNLLVYCEIMRADVAGGPSLSSDGIVTSADIGYAASEFGPNPPPRLDQNADRILSAADLGKIASNFAKNVNQCP